MQVKFWQTIVRFWFFLSYLITAVTLFFQTSFGKKYHIKFNSQSEIQILNRLYCASAGVE